MSNAHQLPIKSNIRWWYTTHCRYQFTASNEWISENEIHSKLSRKKCPKNCKYLFDDVLLSASFYLFILLCSIEADVLCVYVALFSFAEYFNCNLHSIYVYNIYLCASNSLGIVFKQIPSENWAYCVADKKQNRSIFRQHVKCNRYVYESDCISVLRWKFSVLF